MHVPRWRRGFTGQDLRAHFFAHQARYALEHQVKQLERDLARREAEMDALEDRADFYRRQCRLESRLGAMLASITA